MNEVVKNYFQSLWPRLKYRLIPLGDMSAWLLLLISLPLMAVTAPSMVMTLVQWSVFAVALAGVAVMLCRLILPQIDLSEWLEEARKGSMAAAVVVAATLFVYAALFLGLVLWAKT